VEHAHPLDRLFPWRTAALAAGLLLGAALLAGGGLALFHERGATPSESRPGRVSESTPRTTPLRPRSRISVLVLNGNGISGAAGGEATTVLARGYRHAIPTDAPSPDYARSVVLFRPGWQQEAGRLARDARIPAVAPLDGRVAPAYAHVPLVLILGAN
jgi:LytR cell envelope-related transcriptional attenuator